MMKRILARWGVALAVLGGAGAAQAAKELVLAEIHPPGHIIVQSEEHMGSQLGALSKGELGIQIKHSGQLGNEDQAWALIKSGSLDIARVNLTALVKDLAAVKLISLPYLFRSRDHMWRVLEGDFGQRIQREAEKVGAVVLTYYDSGTRSFYSSKKPIQNIADFSGLRVRVQDSPVYKDLITQLGGTPVVLPYNKVVDAFQKGEIDAAENNLPSYYSSGHHKFAKYYSFDEHSSVPEVLVMSRKSWLALTLPQQEALKKAAQASSGFMKSLWAESEQQSLAKAKKEGAIFVDKNRISMTGIEGFATKLYSKYITDPEELNAVLSIMRTK